MNKSELAQVVADRTGLQKAQAEAVIETMVDTIMQTMADGGSVTLAGFGEFSARVRKGRVGVNPQDPSKSIDIPAVPVPKFKAGSRLKKAVKEGALAGKQAGATGADLPEPTSYQPPAQESTPDPEPPVAPTPHQQPPFSPTPPPPPSPLY